MTDTKQPEALRLAEWLETSPYHHDKLVAAELRRLHEVNQELLGALKHCRQKMAHMISHGEWYTPETAIDLADTAIAKAEGESK
jgi:hypothetical protein